MNHRPRTWFVAAALMVTIVSGCTATHDNAHSSVDPSMGTTMDPSMGSMTSTDRSPVSDTGADAGFAYDMGVHHAQAVEMAEMVAGRLADPEVAVVARDIALSQQYQIGEMRGWLDAWGLPPTTTSAPMAWMGMSGPMPGLATSDELDHLRTAPPAEVDQLFLDLMIRHHRGGLTMAQSARDRAQVSFVRQFAATMVDAQTAEIDNMTDLLGRLRR
jgi:uncharacterized protein (DUF305 family)